MKDQNKKSNFTAKEAVKNPVETSAKAPTRAGHPMTVALGSNLKRIREQSGMTQHPWRGVGYAAACASAVFLGVWLVSQRLLARSPFRRPQE